MYISFIKNIYIKSQNLEMLSYTIRQESVALFEIFINC